MATADAPVAVNPLVRRWSRRRGSLIMILHELQDRNGYVPRDLALAVAKAMNIPLARIYEVLTFYHCFRLQPPGRYVVSACDGTACHLRGAPEVIAALVQHLHLSPGQSSADGQFHLQVVRCLGCCAMAPTLMINGKVSGNVQPARIAEWIKSQMAG